MHLYLDVCSQVASLYVGTYIKTYRCAAEKALLHLIQRHCQLVHIITNLHLYGLTPLFLMLTFPLTQGWLRFPAITYSIC